MGSSPIDSNLVTSRAVRNAGIGQLSWLISLKIFDQAEDGWADDANNFMKSGTLMLGVIEKMEEAIDFHDLKARRHLGDVYEQILNDLRSAGNAGEFCTPRAVTEPT